MAASYEGAGGSPMGDAAPEAPAPHAASAEAEPASKVSGFAS